MSNMLNININSESFTVRPLANMAFKQKYFCVMNFIKLIEFNLKNKCQLIIF